MTLLLPVIIRTAAKGCLPRKARKGALHHRTGSLLIKRHSARREASMKIGMLCLWTAGAGAKYTAGPVALARKCESLGFDSFFLSEHPIMPVDVRTPHPVLPVIPDSYAYFPDPFVCLAMVAQATRRLKIGAAVILVPERSPIVTATALSANESSCRGRRHPETMKIGAR